MSLPMHTQYIHFGNLFPVLSGQKQPKPNNKNDTNENKKFNTMANDVITEWKKNSGLPFRCLICCEVRCSCSIFGETEPHC